MKPPNDDFAFLDQSGISSQQFGSQLMKSGVVSRDDIQATWRGLAKDSRSPAALAQSLAEKNKLTPFQASTLLSDTPIPLVLGAYVIQDKLGEGGMGQVFRAVHRKMKREVALKLIASHVLKDEQTIRRFNREVEAAARLSHPNVVTAYDAGETKGLHYLVMEHVVGRDLSSLVRRSGPCSIHDAIDYVIQAARGLGYAHSQGIVHRDIKPANLLLDTHGTLKILDMGLARIEQDADSTVDGGLTGTGMVMGTLDFMAPEQAFDSKTADARSDIYSLGCTLFFLMTGRALFEGDTIMKRILAHREQPIPQLASLLPAASPEIQSVLNGMLAKDAKSRFQSMDAVIAALQPLLADCANSSANGVGSGQASQTSPFEETLAQSAATSETDPGFQPTAEFPSPSSNPSHEQETLAGIGESTVTPQSPSPVIAIQTSEKNSLKRSRTSQNKSRKTLPTYIAGALVVAVAGGLCWALYLAIGPGGPVVAEANSASTSSELPPASPSGNTDTATKSSGLGTGQTLESIAAAGPNKTVEDAFSPPTQETPAAEPPAPETSGQSMTVNVDAAPSIATVPKPDSSDLNPATTSAETPSPNRILVVGSGEGEIPDLQTALEQAMPNDTLLIRDRGPLEFHPIDLTGKTPLTIKGDSSDGVDYWPIVRQAATEPNTYSGDTPGLIYGDELDVTFSKIHLGMGGYSRQTIDAAFALSSGRIEFDQCTITNAADFGADTPIGTPYPLVSVLDDSDGDVEISLKECFVRGGRFDGILHSDGTAKVSVDCEQLTWAGGLAPWLNLGQATNGINVKLLQSTLYNLDSICTVASDLLEKRITPAPLQFDVKRSVIVGDSSSSSDLFRVISKSDDKALTPPEVPTLISWNGDNIVFDQFNKFLPLQGRTAGNLRDFAKAFGLNAKNVIEADPMFRVHASGIELQECDARDFQVRPERCQRRIERPIIATAGSSLEQAPAALACIMERRIDEGDDQSIPRGKPRILKVHQTEGPFRTLEEAFAAFEDDDIIEIADDGVYVPERDFNLSPANGVLSLDRFLNLTLRSVDDSKAVVVLRDRAQRGTLPAFHQDIEVAHNHCLFLFSLDCFSAKIDGIRFRTDISRDTYHSFLHSNSPRVRLTNCEFIDLSKAPHAMVTFYWNNGVCYLSPGTAINDWYWGSLSWFENNVMVHPIPGKLLPKEVRGAEIAVSIVGSITPRHITFRNCAVGGHQVALLDETQCDREYVKYERNTVMARPIGLSAERQFSTFKFRDNLIVCPDRPIVAEPAGIIDQSQATGSHNAVWLTNANFSAAARNTGALRLLPGSVLQSMPSFEGSFSNDDLLRPFRLSPRQKYATMASDGGTIGIRIDYLP